MKDKRAEPEHTSMWRIVLDALFELIGLLSKGTNSELGMTLAVSSLAVAFAISPLGAGISLAVLFFVDAESCQFFLGQVA